MYGDDLLVSPVTVPGVDTWSVYLPVDTWVHLWTGDIIEASSTYYDTPAMMGYPPVYYRQQSPWTSLFESIRSQFG